MHNLQTKTVREIALEMPITTRVFEEFKIDYCCHGNTLFDDACRNVGADPDKVIHEIDGVLGTLGNREKAWLADASPSELIGHILEKHHTYTRQEIRQLTPLIEKVADRHGDHSPNLIELRRVFQQICDDLEPHMMKEEMVLFPYIKELETSLSKQILASTPPFGTVQNPA